MQLVVRLMIEVEQLSKTYGSTTAIQDVTFRVEPGEILGFLGPNGAGKTTTMRILTGYLPADKGSARIAGHDVHQDSLAARQAIGYLPETPPLYPDMSVEGYLNFVARLKGVSAGDRGQRVEASLSKCNLTEKRRVLIRKLSKGFRQRVGIAQAIVHDPPVIVLDEPTVGLDPRQIIDVRNLIKELQGDHTVILSTHILPEVAMTCNKVAIINRGQVVAIDTLDQLMTGTVGYQIEIEGDPAISQTILESLPSIQNVKLGSQEGLSSTRCQLNIVAASNCEPGHEIAEALVTAEIPLYEMRRNRASLEDIFLQLTTQEPSNEQDMDDKNESV
jgi:ABC-2 type transport system ATP-binding protein